MVNLCRMDLKEGVYSNCDESIPTSWSVVARYQGELITPTSGVNPASGVYSAGAGDGDMTKVMAFTIDEEAATRSVSAKRLLPNSFKPMALTDMDMIKREEFEYRMQFAE